MDVYKVAQEFLDSRRLKPKLVGALVGGSYARGKATSHSDIDILAVYKNKYFSEFEKVHSREISFKGFPVSLILQSKKAILAYLKDPDPSVISFLREGVLVYDPTGFLSESIRKAKALKIFKDEEWKAESKRRLKERIEYNIGKIEQAIANEDCFMATYLLRGVLDEVVEKLRMYDGDWLYSQRKSNLKYLIKTLSKHSLIMKLFNAANPPLETKSLKNLVRLLKDFPV